MTFRIARIPSRCPERRGHRARWPAWLLLALAAPVLAETGVAEASAVTLHYRAFLAGAAVGEATVTVTLSDGRYRVEGDARSHGWLSGFTRWRNRFSARGRVGEAAPDPLEFSYTESDADKHRHLVVRDGVMQVTKNGRRRPERPSPAGPDVVSALFVAPSCDLQQVVNTGRHVYRLNRLERSPSGCRYTVTDEDGDSVQMQFTLGRHAGLLVPRRITVHGWLTGSLELVDTQPAQASGR